MSIMMYDDDIIANVCRDLITAIQIFMYEMHRLCNDHCTLMTHVFEKIILVIDQKKIYPYFHHKVFQ